MHTRTYGLAQAVADVAKEHTSRAVSEVKQQGEAARAAHEKVQKASKEAQDKLQKELEKAKAEVRGKQRTQGRGVGDAKNRG
jgi:hypothetical protein